MRRVGISIFVALIALLSTGCVSVRTFEEVQTDIGSENYLIVDDHRVYFEERGEGEPVLFIHGFGASTYSWKEVVPSIAEDFRTIAFDLYGFGYTERPQELERYSRSGQVDLIRGVMDALNLESAHLVAHSYGGALAMTLAHQDPDRVRSLILVDAVGPDYPTRRRRPFVLVPGLGFVFLRGVALRENFVEWVMRKSYERREIVDEEHVEAYRDRIRVEGLIRAYRGLTWPQNDEIDKTPVPFEEIRQSTLVIWGVDDSLIREEIGRKATKEFPDARFVSLPGVGHAPQEEAPQKFIDLTKEFLREQN